MVFQKQIMPDDRLAIYLAKLGTENGNQPESTGMTTQKGGNMKNRDISKKSGFLGRKQGLNNMGALGLEPRTYALKGRCSTS